MWSFFQWENALEVFEDLQRSAIKPNAMTYELIFDIHYQAEDSEAALSIFTKMVIIYLFKEEFNYIFC